MKRDMNNKERRKVVVRGKKKTYTRTMLVKTAQSIGRRESLHQIKLEQANHQPSTMSKLLEKAKSGIKGVLPNRNVGALHSLHPWQEHHTANVETRNSQLGGVQKFYGSSGPGSDHSLFAHMVGRTRDIERAYMEPMQGNPRLTHQHAQLRMAAGHDAMESANRHLGSDPSQFSREFGAHMHVLSTGAATYGGVHSAMLNRYGLENVTEVPQDHKKWVR